MERFVGDTDLSEGVSSPFPSQHLYYHICWGWEEEEESHCSAHPGPRDQASKGLGGEEKVLGQGGGVLATSASHSGLKASLTMFPNCGLATPSQVGDAWAPCSKAAPKSCCE